MQQTPFIIWLYRVARVILHVLFGVLTCAIILPFCNQIWLNKLTHWWCGTLLKCFNIKVNVIGEKPNAQTNSTMFVANHISWMDIHSINSIIPVRFIAKIEIQSWPIFGYLTSKSGTLFINRSIRKDAARIVDITAESLKQKNNVCFFPEGTTTDGTEMLPFKSSIIQAATSTESTLWPMMIYYPKPDGKPNIEMAFAGETTMLESMRAILNQRYPQVNLHFLTPFSCKGHTRHSANQLVFDRISQAFNNTLK